MEEPRKLNRNQDLWLLQDGETAKAFDAFKRYLELGPDRSIQKVADQLGCHYNNAKKWYERWSWAERAGAWENHLAIVELAVLKKERIEMKKRHLRISRVLQNVTTPQLTAWQEQAQEAEAARQAGDKNWKQKLPNIPVHMFIKILESGIRQEQIAFGEPTEIIEETPRTTPRKSLSEAIDEYMELFEEDDGD